MGERGKAVDLERNSARGHLLNFECLDDGVLQLARNTRAAAELASLAFAGLVVKLQENCDLDADGADVDAIRDVLDLATQSACVLARRLGESGAA